MTVMEERTKGAELDAAEGALAEAENTHGRDSVELIQPLLRLAELHSNSGFCGKAEILYKRLVDIVSKGVDRSAIIDALGKLAAVYRCEGKLDDAESVYLKVLSMVGDAPETKRQTAEFLCCLAGVYVQKKDFAQAENALIKAAQLFTEAFGEHSNFSRWCHVGLASIGMQLGKNGEADEHLAHSENAPVQPADAATDQRSLLQLAHEYFKQSRLIEVHMILSQTIYSDEQRLWPDHPRVGQAMHDRGELFLAQARYTEAEKAFKQALQIRLNSLGNGHPEVGQTAMSLGGMYISQGRFSDAEPVLKQAMKSRVIAFGVEHPSVAAAIETYVIALKNTKRHSIASILEARARDIRSKLVWQSERASATGRPPTS